MLTVANPRKLAAFAVSALVGTTVLPYSAQAAWRGLRNFDCVRSNVNWNFDGLYGGFTTRAVRNFQRAHGITVDGVAGPKTYEALGLKYRRSLKCGMGGNDVFLLQQALAAAGYWYGGEGSEKATPKPMPKLTPRPLPTATPEPVPSMQPTPALPSPEPTVAPTAMPAPVETPVENRPTVELKGGDWMLPQHAGSLDYDYTFMRPTWTGDVALWLGDVGLEGGVTDFNQTFTTYRPAEYFAQNTMMYDALLKYRFDHGYWQVFAGYRGIGVGDVNFASLGLALDHPLIGDWLWLQAKAQGGHNFQNSYFLDGQAGLGLRISLLELELGFRHMAFQNGMTDPLFNANGPVANVKLQF